MMRAKVSSMSFIVIAPWLKLLKVGVVYDDNPARFLLAVLLGGVEGVSSFGFASSDFGSSQPMPFPLFPVLVPLDAARFPSR
jgi:hypothetical protein